MQTKIFFSRNKKGQAISRPPAEKILLTCIKKRTHRIFIVQTKTFFSSHTTQPYTQPYTQHHINTPRVKTRQRHVSQQHISQRHISSSSPTIIRDKRKADKKKAGYLTTTCQNNIIFKTNTYYKRTYYIFIV